MSKLSFRARALDASKPMPIYLAEELPDLPDYSAINRAVPQMPSGMEKEEESEHHLQRAISGTGLIIPTPEVSQVCDIDFYERCYPPDYKMPKQHIHMQPLWEEQEAPEYDMDSEDERWLKQQRHPELTELKFEQMMDKLEKCSGQTVVTLHEAKLLLERQDDLVIAVYDYWLNKRLTTQHPLILSVRTENRPGQSSNNPYLAFRRRTEKMQTRKNRKNDESSYEKMLKLRRDLARALSLLELVARRERAKRELVKLTALLADRRYVAGDFANQLLPDPPPRPAYTTVPVNPPFRREPYATPHYVPRVAPPPVDVPRQREKRPYKRRKHRHAPVSSAQGHRDSGVYTSSEEESVRVEPASPPDDGPFAFRRKPGCYYEMPTSTLCGDPVDPDNPSKEGFFQHELDPRHRYTLTSIRSPYPQCVGFARRRVGRGGRVLLDRVQTPLDDLWPHLPFHLPDDKDKQEREIENNRYRTPKEITTDYHTSGKYPWRHAFRRHLSRHPDLWTDVKPDVTHVKQDDIKPEDFFKLDKVEPMDLPDIVQDSERCKSDDVKNEIKSDTSVRTMDMDRKRSWSDCSDSSYDSDESLHPVEKEFEQFIDEVNHKWLHFRPRTATPSPPPTPRDEFPLSQDTPIAVELLNGDPFTTAEFTLAQLYPQLDGSSLDVEDGLLTDNFTGLTEDQMESILSETDLKSLADDRKLSLSVAMLDGLDDRGGPADKQESFGSSSVVVSAGGKSPVYCSAAAPPAPAPSPAPAPRPRPRNKHNTTKKVVEPRPLPVEAPLPPPVTPAPVPSANIIVEEVNDLPTVRIDSKRKKEDTIEEVQLGHGVQLKTVHTRHSPLKKHIITSGARVRSEPVAVSSAPHPHIVTQPVSDALKVRLQNHLLSGQGSVLVQNGPYTGPVVAVPVASSGSGLPTAGVSVASTSSARRLQLGGAVARAGAGAVVGSVPAMGAVTHAPVLLHSHAPSKLKVLHAHTLTHSQRTQILAQTQNRNISQVPAVVSLATISDPKSAMLYKPAQGSVAQLFEIKSGQLGKGPHLVNVVRQPQQGKPTLARLDINDKKRPLVFDATLKGNIACTTRPHRVAVLDRSSLEGRIVRAPLPPHVRHQLQFKNRPLAGPSTPPTKTASIPSAVVANLLHKTHQLPKGGQKIAISGPGGQALSANVQAIAISTAQLKARQARLVAPPRPPPVTEIVEASSATTSQQAHQDTSLHPAEETETNGTVRRRAADTLPMEVT